MGHLSPGDIVRYQKGTDPPIFSTLKDLNKEYSWGNTWKIRILGQYKILEAGEDLLTPPRSPYQLLTNLDWVDKDALLAKLTR